MGECASSSPYARRAWSASACSRSWAESAARAGRPTISFTLRCASSGEADRHLATDIAAALAGVGQPSFEIQLSGLGWFESRGRPDTIWAGVTPQGQLKALHNKIERALDRVGVAPDSRAFVPHITLARLKPSSGPLGGLLEQGALASPPFVVDSFGLYESDLTPGGAVHSLVERYGLL